MGRVVADETGEGISEAAVYLVGGIGGDSAETEADGSFVIENVTPGRYRGQFIHSEYLSKSCFDAM